MVTTLQITESKDVTLECTATQGEESTTISCASLKVVGNSRDDAQRKMIERIAELNTTLLTMLDGV